MWTSSARADPIPPALQPVIKTVGCAILSSRLTNNNHDRGVVQLAVADKG